MKSIIFGVAIAAATLLGKDDKPAQILVDSLNPGQYMQGSNRVPGMVKLKLDIDENGKLRNVKALKGRPDLVGPAFRMLKDYRFAPAESDGKPVKSALDLELNFRFAPSYNQGQ